MEKTSLVSSGAAALFLGVALSINPAPSLAQIAGSSVIAVDVTTLREVASGWSAKRQVLGQTVYNEKAEKVGTVVDLIVSPDKAVSYVIVNAGNLIGAHDVAVATSRFSLVADKLTLVGATRDGLLTAPVFQYE